MGNREETKLLGIHDGQRGLILKMPLGFFPETLAALINVIDSLQKYVRSRLSLVKFFLMGEYHSCPEAN